MSGKATLTDYNFTTPSTKLTTNTPTGLALTNIASYEVFDYPGRYVVTADGTALSKVRMEEFEVPADNVVGAGRCSSFGAGGTFTPKLHPADTGAFVLLAVEHSGSEAFAAGQTAGPGGDYRNGFVCMPAATPFRSTRATPRPVISGPQPAVVVGPSGEEIYTEQYGRIKVQFYWDRYGQGNETSSCWMRVAEMWAGKNWGMVFTPRIGQEVLVEFLEGDPDQPIVTGRVYNADQMPPYALPDNMTRNGLKTRSSKGGGADDANELWFEDKKGNELISFHAQKDFLREVEHDDTETVLGNQVVSVKLDRTETVTDGNETITISKGDRTETVSTGNESVTISKGDRTIAVSKGNDTHTISEGCRTVTVSKGDDTLSVSAGKRTTTVEKDDATTVSSGDMTLTVSAGKRTTEVNGDDALTVKTGAITIKASAGAITIDGMQGITLKCGSNSIKVAPDGITVAGMKVSIKADTQTEVKGTMVAVSGDAMCQVKGGVTMIG